MPLYLALIYSCNSVPELVTPSLSLCIFLGLSHVLVLSVYLVNLFCWMGKGDHSNTFLAPTGALEEVILDLCKENT